MQQTQDVSALRVISWNMHYSNRNLELAIAEMRALDPDVVCLQEVPATAIEILRRGLGLPHFAVGEDYLHTGVDTYVVTLSRYPFVDQLALTNPGQRTRFHRWFGGREGQQAVATSLNIGGRIVRVLNVHLPLHVPPSRRLAIVEGYLASDEKPDLFCGDFNSCGRPWLAPFMGFLHSYGLADYAYHEQRRLARLMEAHGMENPFRGVRTHAQMPFQLDGIYTATDSIASWQQERMATRWGSDHWPLVLHAVFHRQIRRVAA